MVWPNRKINTCLSLVLVYRYWYLSSFESFVFFVTYLFIQIFLALLLLLHSVFSLYSYLTSFSRYCCMFCCCLFVTFCHFHVLLFFVIFTGFLRYLKKSKSVLKVKEQISRPYPFNPRLPHGLFCCFLNILWQFLFYFFFACFGDFCHSLLHFFVLQIFFLCVCLSPINLLWHHFVTTFFPLQKHFYNVF